MITTLSAKNLSLSYGAIPVLKDVSLTLPARQITAIVGPNASGKTTLLRCLARLQKPGAGEVYLGDQPIGRLPSREVARALALLPQRAEAPEGMRVSELVMRGRTPHQSPFRPASDQDHHIVAEALERVGLSGHADRPLSELSGGQAQRAWIAFVLAQDTDILLLDEPTTYLDLPHQYEILELVRRLQAERGLTVAMVLHDINLAARFADHLVALKDHQILCEGPPEDVLSIDTMQSIYGMACSVIPDPVSGKPHIIPR